MFSIEPEMAVCAWCSHASPWCSLNKAFFDQIRLDHVLKRIRLFADSGSQVFDTDGTALELLNDREQELAVETV